MEDEKDLDLSLALPCGGSSSSLKGKYGGSSDIRSDEGDRGSKLINEFKNFLEGGTQQHNLKVEEKLCNNFAKAAMDLETSKNSTTGGIQLTTNGRSTEIEEERRSGVGDKRKSLFIETNQQKKHERETNHPDMTDKTKTSHISITTDEGSTAENEDVADSEVDGSTSKHASQNDDVSKRFVSSDSLSKGQKDAFGDSGSVEILGQKRYTISSENEFNMTNMPVPYGVSFPAQPVNINMSYSQSVKDLNSSGTPSLSSYPLPGIMHATTAPNGERPGIQSVIANFPLMFGYSPIQVPALDRDNSHHQQIHESYSGWNQVNHNTQSDSRKLTQEHGRSNGKRHVGEEGTSSHTEGDLKGNHAIHQVKDASDEPRAETIPSEYPAIRPGIAADLKFGGCGSYPNLPWVSTTGPGPSRRTISGVTYRYNPTQIRIVCACHGSHMSPEEFVRHASEENKTPDASNALASLPSSNLAASAHS